MLRGGALAQGPAPAPGTDPPAELSACGPHSSCRVGARTEPKTSWPSCAGTSRFRSKACRLLRRSPAALLSSPRRWSGLVEDPRGQHSAGGVERLPSEQAAIDCRYGLRRVLQAELDDCRQMLERLAEAQAEITCAPLPRVVRCSTRSASGSRPLQQQLGNPSTRDPAAGSGPSCSRRWLQADSLEQLSAIRQVWGAAEPLGLLDADERARAFALPGRPGFPPLRPPGHLPHHRPGPGGTQAPAPCMRCSRPWPSDSGVTLVVDGHNVLFTLPALFRPFFDNGEPGRSGATRLSSAWPRWPGAIPVSTSSSGSTAER